MTKTFGELLIAVMVYAIMGSIKMTGKIIKMIGAIIEIGCDGIIDMFAPDVEALVMSFKNNESAVEEQEQY